MIVDAILNVCHAMIHWILGGILSQPDVTVGTGFLAAAARSYVYVNALGNLAPSVQIFLGLSVIVVIETSILGYKALSFIWKKIPGFS